VRYRAPFTEALDGVEDFNAVIEGGAHGGCVEVKEDLRADVVVRKGLGVMSALVVRKWAGDVAVVLLTQKVKEEHARGAGREGLSARASPGGRLGRP
jgi:hypothetical protein